MTLPIVLILAGTMLIYSGWKGYSPTKLLVGSIEPTSGSEES